MAETVEAEVIPPGQQPKVRGFNPGIIHRPGFTMFTVGVLTGLVLAGVAVYVIKKKL